MCTWLATQRRQWTAQRDNCHLQFKYAVMKKTPDYMVVVVLEEVGNSFDEFFRSRNLDKLFLSEP